MKYHDEKTLKNNGIAARRRRNRRKRKAGFFRALFRDPSCGWCVLPAAVLAVCAAAAPLAVKDPLFPKGGGSLVRMDAERIGRVKIEDGLNIPVVLEKQNGSWFLLFDDRIRYPADTYKAAAFLSEITGKNRVLRPVPRPKGMPFPLEISVTSSEGGKNETARQDDVFYAGAAEAGGGFRFVVTPGASPGVFKTEDFFYLSGIDTDDVMAMRTWMDRTPFRGFFSDTMHGSVQRMVFRVSLDFDTDGGGGSAGKSRVFSAGNDAEKRMIAETESTISRLTMSDVTNVPFEKMFEIECDTGHGDDIVFSFGLIRPVSSAATAGENQNLGVVSESERSWITGAGTVLELMETFLSSSAR